jgi:hypothetical protein
MTPAERIQPAIVAVFNSMIGRQPAPPEYNDIKKLLTDDPEMLAYARDEIKRLRENGRRGVLAENDYESKIRCQALERMIELYEAAP